MISVCVGEEEGCFALASSLCRRAHKRGHHGIVLEYPRGCAHRTVPRRVRQGVHDGGVAREHAHAGVYNAACAWRSNDQPNLACTQVRVITLLVGTPQVILRHVEPLLPVHDRRADGLARGVGAVARVDEGYISVPKEWA